MREIEEKGIFLPERTSRVARLYGIVGRTEGKTSASYVASGVFSTEDGTFVDRRFHFVRRRFGTLGESDCKILPCR